MLLTLLALGCVRSTQETAAPDARPAVVAKELKEESPADPPQRAAELEKEPTAAAESPARVASPIREDAVLAVVHEKLGDAYLTQRAYDRAAEHFEKACDAAPEDARLRLVYGAALLQAGRVREGQGQFERVLKVDSVAIDAANHLAWSLATDPHEAHRDGKRAVKLAMRVCERTEALPRHWDTLAAALAENNEFERAQSAAAEAVRRAVSLGELEAAASMRARFASYNIGLPHRAPPRPPAAESPETVAEHPKVRDHFMKSSPDPKRMPQVLLVTRALASHADSRVRDGRAALRIAQRLNELTRGEDPTCLVTVAAALAAQERWTEAAETAHVARDLFIKAGLNDQAREAADHAALYFTAKPLVEHRGDVYEPPAPGVENPLRRVAHAYWLVAKNLAGAPRLEDALTACKAGIEFDPTYAPGHVLLARLAMDQLRPAEAREPLLTADALGCDSADFYRQWARLAIAYHEMDEAERFYRRAIERAPDEARLREDFIWFQATRPDDSEAAGDEAVRLAEAMIAEAGTPTLRQLEISSAAYAAAGRFEEAIDAVRRAGKLAEQQGNSAKAGSLYMRVALFDLGEKFTTEAAALARLAVEELTAGRNEAAISLLVRSVELRPTDLPTILNLGTAYMGAGKIREAVAAFRTVIRLAPNDSKAYNNLAWLLATQEMGEYFDPRGAIVLAQQSLKLEATPHPERLDTLALAHAAANEFEEAYLIASRAAQLAKEAGRLELATEIEDRAKLYSVKTRYTTPLDAHRFLGKHALKAGKTEEAQRHFEAAVRLNPNDAKLWADLGAVQIALDQVQSAVEANRKALAIDPFHPGAANNLAWLIATGQVNGDAQEAVMLSEQACESTGYGDARFLDTLAASYAAAGRYGDAVDIADKALEVANTGLDGEPSQSIAMRRQLYQRGQPYRILQELGPINAEPELSPAEFVSP